jgi:aminoglycoside phosphotransferase (APT) family kinase protein
VTDPSAEVHDVLAERVMTKDVRDPAELVERVAEWLGPELGSTGPVQVSDIEAPSGNGMSCVTLVMDCVWNDAHGSQERRLVTRIAPDTDSFPVFPSYDLSLQYDVMAGVGEHSAVPVPPLVGIEPTGDVIGSPFLVMEHVEGRAPLDNPPYVFGGWLHDATPDERAGLEEATLGVLAAVHDIAEPRLLFPRLAAVAGADPLRAHVEGQRAYYGWTHRQDGVRVPLLERAFTWLEGHWPAEPGDPVLSWGDARPGNILFESFEPAAVLDWEMAALAPRELDVAWYVFIHRFFQDIATVFEMPGLPDLAEPQRVAATYERISGHPVRDLHWYIVYAALRHGIVMAQIKRRMVHFGEEERPEDPDDYVMHRAALEQLLEEGE